MDRYGMEIGFDGMPVTHKRDLPDGVGRNPREHDMSHRLPIEGYWAGMQLISVEPRGGIDPICLYDRWGKILYQWEEGLTPSSSDVREVVLKLI